MTFGQGERWGSYLLEERIAAGGMAEVFRARRVGAVGFTRVVCIKRMHRHLSEDAEFVGLFLDEGRTGAKLRHRNIVAVDDLGEHAGQFFIAMEYVHGVDLAQVEARLRATGESFSANAAVFVAMEVLAALGAAHRATDPDDGAPLKVVHRDVAPHNVLVSFSGEVKLGDFGIARAERRARVTSGGVIRGRFGYMPLEQLSGTDVDGRADLFALGVVLYEMLAGQRPFLGAVSDATMESIVAAQVMDQKRPLSELRPGLSEELYLVVDALLAKDPAERFSTADAALAVLERASERVGGGQALAALMARLFPSHASVAAVSRDSIATGPLGPPSSPAPTPTQRKPAALEVIASDPMARPFDADPRQSDAPSDAAVVPREVAPAVRWPTVLLAASFFVASATAVGLFVYTRPRDAGASVSTARTEPPPLPVSLDAGVTAPPPSLVASANMADASAPSTAAAPVVASPPISNPRNTSPVTPTRRDPERVTMTVDAGARVEPAQVVRAASERGVIRVVVTPFGRVSIDDGALSEEFSNHRDFPVSAGAHRVRVTGGVEDSVSVTVRPGQTETVRFHGG